MAKECPFKTITSMDYTKDSGGSKNGEYTKMYFSSCIEEECMAWNSKDGTCKRLEPNYIVVNTKEIENSIIKEELPEDNMLVNPPCGAETCNGCSDYNSGDEDELPCPDWCKKEIEFRKVNRIRRN